MCRNRKIIQTVLIILTLILGTSILEHPHEVLVSFLARKTRRANNPQKVRPPHVGCAKREVAKAQKNLPYLLPSIVSKIHQYSCR